MTPRIGSSLVLFACLASVVACGSATDAASTNAAAASTSANNVTASDAGATSDAGTVQSPTDTLPVAPLGHQGRWLTDADGRVFLGHGVNVVEKNAPYYPAAEGFDDDDAAWLADNGFRIVRVGILATGLMPTAGVVDANYVKEVAATVHDLAQHSIFSILDFHQDGWGPTIGSDGFPDWMTNTGNAFDTHTSFPTYYLTNPAIQQAFQSFWDDTMGPDGKGLQDNYAAMFGAVATELASEPYVLGYDLFNEPWPGNSYVSCSAGNGCASLDASELAPAYAKAVAAIRAAGDQHTIFGEPFVLFNYGLSATNIPLPGGDANSGLSFHVYPVTASEASLGIDEAIKWSKQTGGALITTEWGAVTDSDTLTKTSIDLDTAFMPWVLWSFCCELVPSFDAGPGGANLVQTTAQALIQPYPLAVAGVPQSLTMDPVAKTMSFTWSNTRADGGGTFGQGAITTFEAPAFTYPAGYQVTVTGGTVTSAACAPVLTVAASDGATVTVSIAPGGELP